MSKMLPIPKIPNAHFAEARKFEAAGSHRKLYRFSPGDYKAVASLWNGPSPDGSGPLEVVDGPPEGGRLPDLADIGEAFTPEYHPNEIFEMAQKLYAKAK
jgi:Mn-containing catalase